MTARTVALAALSACLLGVPGVAQEGPPTPLGPSGGFSLEPPRPNPFERETRIPFVLDASLFEATEAVVVSVRIYNLLHQLVATARLEEGEGDPRRLENLRLRVPGRYVAVWDGRDLRGDRVTEGPYFIQLLVDGRSQVRKVLFVR